MAANATLSMETGERDEREREREKKEDDVNIMARPRIFANFGDISALVRPTNARFFL